MCAGAVRSALVKVPGVVDADQTKVTKDDESAVVLVKKGAVTADQLVKAVAAIDGGYVASLKGETTKETPKETPKK